MSLLRCHQAAAAAGGIGMGTERIIPQPANCGLGDLLMCDRDISCTTVQPHLENHFIVLTATICQFYVYDLNACGYARL